MQTNKLRIDFVLIAVDEYLFFSTRLDKGKELLGPQFRISVLCVDLYCHVFTEQLSSEDQDLECNQSGADL